VPEDIDDVGHVHQPGLVGRPPDVEGLERHDLLQVALDQVGQAVQEQAALRAGQP